MTADLMKIGIIMSLKLNNRATPAQIQILKDLDYVGKWNLSTDEAATIIQELWDEKRMQLDRDEENNMDYLKEE